MASVKTDKCNFFVNYVTAKYWEEVAVNSLLRHALWHGYISLEDSQSFVMTPESVEKLTQAIGCASLSENKNFCEAKDKAKSSRLKAYRILIGRAGKAGYILPEVQEKMENSTEYPNSKWVIDTVNALHWQNPDFSEWEKIKEGLLDAVFDAGGKVEHMTSAIRRTFNEPKLSA
jgi:hypothetical protein